MSDVSLEDEIMAQLRRLDREQQQTVLNFVRTISQTPMSLDEWFQLTDALYDEMRAKYGEHFEFNSLSILHEIREGRLNDLLGGR